MTALVWLRRDLRLSDHPALLAAVRRKEPVIPLYIDAAEEEGEAALGAASRWWLHESLAALALELERLGSRLILRRGAAAEVLTELVGSTKATAVYWNRCYEPAIIKRDTAVKEALKALGCHTESFNGELLREPWTIKNGEGKPYRVFTPFWRACQAAGEIAAPEKAPATLLAPSRWPASLKLEQLGLKPKIPWDAGLSEAWTPGERGARKVQAAFLKNRVATYVEKRDFPGVLSTSTLSPYLAFGEVSVRQLWHALPEAKAAIKPGQVAGASGGGAAAFLRQLGWREFAYHLLYHFPDTVARPLRPEFNAFPWAEGGDELRRWQRGQTGYPVIDAGMRELWTTGIMHNRVRMLVGSFLVKDLLIPWQQGAAWFWDTLVDADLANNTLGWQWVAGSGADAAPYFRVFNPITQGEKFDGDGSYVRRWVPELSRLPDRWLHQPFAAPPALLKSLGIRLGVDYPLPIVDHAAARERALLAYHRLPKSKDARP